MRHIPEPYEKYRHFKGGLYQILAIAKDSEDGSRKVVYQQLYEPFEIYVRDLAMFLSPVDREKYPAVTQEYRFEQIEGGQDIEWSGSVEENAPEWVSVNSGLKEDAEKIENGEGRYETAGEEKAAEAALDPFLLKFLDADTYEEKLDILTSMHARIDQEMINTIAVALDVEIAPGETEERYRQLKECLITLEKYECNRLR